MESLKCFPHGSILAGQKFKPRRPLSGQLLKYLLSIVRSAAVYLAWNQWSSCPACSPRLHGDFTLIVWVWPLCNCCFQGFPILIYNHPDSLVSILWLLSLVRLRLSACVLPALFHGQGCALRAKLYKHGSLLLSRVASERNETIATYLSRGYWTLTGFVSWASPRLPRFHLVFCGSLSRLSHPRHYRIII